MSDDVQLTPEYRFEWSDGTVRTTTDNNAFDASDPVPEEYEDEDGNREKLSMPEAIETLAHLAREDDDCEVTLIGMGA